MKLCIRVQDDPMYPYRDMKSHAALTLATLKLRATRTIEEMVTHMNNSAQELHITIEVKQQEEAESE